jgi:hypothetical protein
MDLCLSLPVLQELQVPGILWKERYMAEVQDRGLLRQIAGLALTFSCKIDEASLWKNCVARSGDSTSESS